jgi:hypothetical protein
MASEPESATEEPDVKGTQAADVVLIELHDGPFSDGVAVGL